MSFFILEEFKQICNAISLLPTDSVILHHTVLWYGQLNLKKIYLGFGGKLGNRSCKARVINPKTILMRNFFSTYCIHCN
jgi:hypothetical protein